MAGEPGNTGSLTVRGRSGSGVDRAGAGPGGDRQAQASLARGRPNLRSLLPTLADVALPVAIYYVLHSAGVGDVVALSAGGLVSGLQVVLGVVRKRRLDGLAALVLALFVLSIGMMFLTGDARFVLAKESVYTGLGGMYALVTLLTRRPLGYYAVRRMRAGNDPAALAEFDRLWERSAELRRMGRLLTAVWGTAFLVEALARLVVVYSMPVSTAVAVSQVPAVVAVGTAVVFSAVYGRRTGKRIAAEQAMAGAGGES